MIKRTSFSFVFIMLTTLLVLSGCKKEGGSSNFTLQEKQGDVMMSEDGESWAFADLGQIFMKKDYVRTGAGGKTTLQMGEGSVSLAENTQLQIDTLEADEVWMTQSSGRTYHRVGLEKGGVYGVKALGHLVSATGPVFELSVNAEANRINVKALDGKVKVAIEGAGDQLLETGQEITVDPAGTPVFSIAMIPGFVPTETEMASRPTTNAPASASPTPKTVTPVPSSTSPTCTPGLSGKKSLDGFSLSWTKCEGDNFQFYKLLRSRLNATPTYPADPVIFSSPNPVHTSYFDRNLEFGVTYYYRVCAIYPVNIGRCSNTVPFTN